MEASEEFNETALPQGEFVLMMARSVGVLVAIVAVVLRRGAKAFRPATCLFPRSMISRLISSPGRINQNCWRIFDRGRLQVQKGGNALKRPWLSGPVAVVAGASNLHPTEYMVGR